MKKRIAYFMAFIICQMMAMTASAQELNGKWKLGDVAKDMGDGVEMHISGKYTFDAGNKAKAEYRIIGTMAVPATDNKDAKSVYFELLIDGCGKYSMTDSVLSVNLDKTDKSFKMGEGTFDKMVPAYRDSDPKGEDFLRVYFTALTDILADGFKSVSIRDVAKKGNVISGTLMDKPVTLTKTE